MPECGASCQTDEECGRLRPVRFTTTAAEDCPREQDKAGANDRHLRQQQRRAGQRADERLPPGNHLIGQQPGFENGPNDSVQGPGSGDKEEIGEQTIS